jgi:WD40-like Beta Propeller Repeat
MRSRTRRGTLLVVAAMLGLSCTADDPDPTQDRAFESVTPTASVDAPLPGRVLFSRMTPSGEFLHFSVSPDGSAESPFVPGVEFEARHLSPDGSLLAISAPNEQGLLVGGTVGVDGTGYRLFATTDPSLNLVCGVWASRGRLACEGWDDSDPSRAGIYTVRASDRTDPQRLTRRRDIPCEYSPDGTQLAFVRTVADDGRGTLMVMDAAGGKARELLNDVVLTGIPCDWSPDGSSILASSAGALHFVTLDGETSRLAGDGISGFAMGGLWSPDGSHVLFSMALEDQQFDVYTAAADGSGLTAIADSEVLEESAYWLP